MAWGAASIADTRQLQSPFRSGIEIESYQLDPVVRAIQMPRVNLLIADDVGLGKTIESGMVVLELMLRHRANRVLVACPSSLQIKWRDEMLEKFGLDFVIVDSALIKRLRRERGLYANPWTHFPRLITSMDYLKREYPLRMFREAVAHEGARPGLRDFDILIVDEAHNAAPSGTGNFALDSQRTQALREIGKHFEHKALPRDGVVLAVDRVGDWEEVALFGEEEEDQPHHQSERSFVDVFAVQAVEQGASAFAVSAIECGDEHLHGASHLSAERGGDFLLVLQAAAVEGVEGLLGRAVEEGAGGEEVAKSAQGESLVKPQFGVEVGKAGGLAGLGVDQGEALAVGDQAERNASGAQQLGHARGAGSVPGCGWRTPVGLLGRRKQANEQERLAIFDQGQIGPQGLVVLGD